LTPGGIHKENKVSITFNYTDGKDVLPLEIQNWWATNGQHKGTICAPFHWTGKGEKYNGRTVIFHMPLQVPYGRAGQGLESITVPVAGKHNALHLFALSYIKAIKSAAPNIQAGRVAATRRWDGDAQVVEVVVLNAVSLTSDIEAWARDLTVSLSGSSFKTIREARISRIMPADQLLVELLVKPTNKSTTFNDAQLVVNGSPLPVHVEGPLVHDFSAWTAADAEQHAAPKWFSDAKFGIFIH
jgi:hypothetical protein